MEKHFRPEVVAKLKYYVYRLIDPTNGLTFYVGKGKGNRVFDHASGTIKPTKVTKAKGEPSDIEDRQDLKLKTIEEIRSKNLSVQYVIHRHGIEDERTAYEVEAALMDAYAGLTNRAAGHRSADFGIAHPNELVSLYEAQQFKAKEPLLLINVSQTSKDSDTSIYDSVRGVWKIDPNRAGKVRLVLAHKQGRVVGAFRPEGDWLPAKKKNFPWLAEDIQGRWGFVGVEADASTRKTYVDKRIPDEFRRKGSANPIRFVGDKKHQRAMRA